MISPADIRELELDCEHSGCTEISEAFCPKCGWSYCSVHAKDHETWCEFDGKTVCGCGSLLHSVQCLARNVRDKHLRQPVNDSAGEQTEGQE